MSALHRPQAAPRRRQDGPGVLPLLFGLAAGPTAWIIHLLLNYGLSSYACYPADQPHLTAPPPGWAIEKPVLVAITLACLALAGLGLWTSWFNWRNMHEGAAKGPHHVIEVGEGRACFLALCGLLTSAGFALAIAASAASILRVPSCWTFGG